MFQSDDELQILIVTDIHDEWKMLLSLKKQVIDEHTKYDAVFVLGDLDNIQQNLVLPNEEYKQIESEQIVLKILKFLEFAGCPIYYIPGNHDSSHFFNNNLYLFDNCLNVHRNKVVLNSSLSVYGIGGSIPGYYNGKHEFHGYPYVEDSQIKPIIQELELKLANEENDVLLLTHNPPDISQTQVYTNWDCPSYKVFCGSSEISRLLENKKIIANLHGHTHPGFGYLNFFNCRVINPGSLKDGRYCELKLKKTDRWKIKEVVFKEIID